MSGSGAASKKQIFSSSSSNFISLLFHDEFAFPLSLIAQPNQRVLGAQLRNSLFRSQSFNRHYSRFFPLSNPLFQIALPNQRLFKGQTPGVIVRNTTFAL